MTFWQFVDKRLDRASWPRARTVAGAGIFILTVMVFVMMFLKPDLAKDDLFKMLAQAVVVQGLVGLAMAYWFTAKERESHPQQVEVANTRRNPVPVSEGEDQ